MYCLEWFNLTISPFLCKAMYNNKNPNNSAVIIGFSYALANCGAIKDYHHSIVGAS